MNSAGELETSPSGAKLVPVDPATQPLPSQGPTEENAKRPLFQSAAWWCLVVLSLAADFLWAPTITAFNQWRGVIVVLPFVGLTLAVGCTLAQGSLLAAWLAWSDAPFSRRLLWHWIIAGLLCGIWLFGASLITPPDDEFHDVIYTVAITVPLVSLGAQLPFWTVRILFGWRLVRISGPTADMQSAAEQSLSIRDLLFATLIVAASFAVARLSPAAIQAEEFRNVWGVMMLAAAAFSVLAILPAAAILSRPRPFGRAVLYSLYLAAVPIALLWSAVAIIRIYGLTNLPPWYAFVGLTLSILSYAGTAILAAAVARNQGYLLAWGRTGAIYQAAPKTPSPYGRGPG